MSLIAHLLLGGNKKAFVLSIMFETIDFSLIKLHCNCSTNVPLWCQTATQPLRSHLNNETAEQANKLAPELKNTSQIFQYEQLLWFRMDFFSLYFVLFFFLFFFFKDGLVNVSLNSLFHMVPYIHVFPTFKKNKLLQKEKTFVSGQRIDQVEFM